MTRSSHLPHAAILFAAVAVLLWTAAPARAQNTFALGDLEDGQLILNLNASEQVDVDQDTLNVTMQYVAQGRDRIAIQDEVNRALRDARNILEDTDNIDYSIQRYNVYMTQPGQPRRQDSENPTWRAQQGIQMQSMNSEALLVVTARLQEAGLTVNNLAWSLSSERYEEVSDSLMAGALRKLQARADEAAEILGKSRADLVEVNINGSQNFFGGRVMMAESASASSRAMSVPVAEPGKTQVSMNVNARALLSP